MDSPTTLPSRSVTESKFDEPYLAIEKLIRQFRCAIYRGVDADHVSAVPRERDFAALQRWVHGFQCLPADEFVVVSNEAAIAELPRGGVIIFDLVGDE